MAILSSAVDTDPTPSFDRSLEPDPPQEIAVSVAGTVPPLRPMGSLTIRGLVPAPLPRLWSRYTQSDQSSPVGRDPRPRPGPQSAPANGSAGIARSIINSLKSICAPIGSREGAGA
jgi:hypothetical protein